MPGRNLAANEQDFRGKRMPENCGRPGMSRPDCSGCSVAARRGEAGPDDWPFQRRPLALASIGLFLGPSILALVGAACFSSSPESQLLGATTGLVVGTGGSVGVAKLIRRANRKTP